MRIENVVAGLPYEKEPFFPFRYEEETIKACETAVGQPFPEDLRWYLANVGWREIDYDHRAILVREGDYLYLLNFEKVTNQVFAEDNYTGYVSRNEGGSLPGDPARYFPITEIKGEMNPQVSFRVLVSLNDADRGSVWLVRPIGHFGDQTPSEPIRIADDLAGFLEQVSSRRKSEPVAEKNNSALFKRLFDDYLKAPAVPPTSAGDIETLLHAFFDNRENTLFDGARNVEFNRHIQAQRFENAEKLSAVAELLAREMPTSAFHGSTAVRRGNIKIGKAAAYDAAFAADRLTPGFMTVPVKSLVGDGMKMKEEYLLFHDAGSKQWTIVRRLESAIGNVKVPGVGTFAYDSTYKWHLKAKVQPAWSELKAELNVDGEEDALTAGRIEFIKEIVAKAEFRPILEDDVFRLYRDRYYPDFEAMDEDEKKDWAKDFPAIADSSEVWRLFKKKSRIHVESDRVFTVWLDAGFDPEHGLEVRVEDWTIRHG
ncbi:hypothetical protein KX729_20115 [Rhizobium sp. XQZ8]|uniref:DUF6985 domain-containing protein n=1 Tax=Rhizobium populisoli TaxID=2859785 RepID=UPI001CA5EA72|nr:hypothetical protein [Rhizobium populisoli]MBW6423769.1 hypothetical protein [Rhizobium populisoli]